MDVVIADSRPEVLSALRVHLAEEPDVHVVAEALDIASLLSAVCAVRPDVVLVDWNLDGSDVRRPGAALLTEIATASPGTRVVALSARLDARVEALEAGADAFVSKCAPADRLLVALRSLYRED